jgi:5,10-methylenetetrahydromethanopterin reductase
LNHAMRFGLEGKHLPEALKARVQTYVDGYELYDHVLSAGRNPKRMEELGLTGYAISRWALAGNPSDWVKRIEEVAAAGATKLWVGIGRGDYDRQKHYMRMFGEQILPHFA